MNDIEIPGVEWSQFCERFTRRHQGRLVRIHQLERARLAGGSPPAPGSLRPLAPDRPLREIRERHGEGGGELMVTVAEGKDDTSLLVEEVTALYEYRRGGAPFGMRIDSANGVSTLVEVCDGPPRSPADGPSPTGR